MNDTTTFKNQLHWLKKKQKKMRTLCQPLFDNSNINFFNYTRIEKSGNWLCLSTDAESLQDCLKYKLKIPYLEENASVLESGHYFFNDLRFLLLGKKNPKELTDCFHHIDNFDFQLMEKNKATFKNSILFVKKHETFEEIFFFSSNMDHNYIRSYYTEHMDSLKQFCFYFVSSAKDIIKKELPENSDLKHLSIKKANRSQKNKLFHPKKEQLSQAILVKKYRFITNQKEIFLTKNEFTSLSLAASGLSNAEMGVQMNLKTKTIDQYMSRIITKLDCKNKRSLISLYKEAVF